MFTQGVRPVMFSVKDGSWRNVGDDIEYGRSYVCRENGQQYYTLSFEVSFKHKEDTLYLAMNLPYTYHKMIKLLDEVQSSTIPPNIVIERKVLCYTASNHALPYLVLKTETSKKQVVVTARQHPGETVSSHVFEAFLKSVLENPLPLLQQIELIVVPMVNPDGVVYGNFRTNIAGFDLNRQWSDPNRWLHTESYFLKRMLGCLPNLCFMLDLHGHSKKYNTFIYACEQEDKVAEKYFPYLMSKHCDFFRLDECTYGLTRDKVSTARAAVLKVGVKDVYTLQTSFYAYFDKNQESLVTLGPKSYKNLGSAILKSLTTFFYADQKEKEVIRAEISDKMPEFEAWQSKTTNDSGSESNPSEDELTPVEREEKVMSQQIAAKTSPTKYRNRNHTDSVKRKRKKKKETTMNNSNAKVSLYGNLPEGFSRTSSPSKDFRSNADGMHSSTFKSKLNPGSAKKTELLTIPQLKPNRPVEGEHPGITVTNQNLRKTAKRVEELVQIGKSNGKAAEDRLKREKSKHTTRPPEEQTVTQYIQSFQNPTPHSNRSELNSDEVYDSSHNDVRDKRSTSNLLSSGVGYIDTKIYNEHNQMYETVGLLHQLQQTKMSLRDEQHRVMTNTKNKLPNTTKLNRLVSNLSNPSKLEDRINKTIAMRNDKSALNDLRGESSHHEETSTSLRHASENRKLIQKATERRNDHVHLAKLQHKSSLSKYDIQVQSETGDPGSIQSHFRRKPATRPKVNQARIGIAYEAAELQARRVNNPRQLSKRTGDRAVRSSQKPPREQIFLSELMRPRISDDSRLLYLRIEEDITNKLKNRAIKKGVMNVFY